MILGKSGWIQKIHWYFTGQLSCLVARISAKRQVTCWQSSRNRCSCGCISGSDRVCSLHKGRQNHQSCPSIPVSHSCQRMSALTSPSLSLILAALPRWPLHELQVQLLRQSNNYSETTPCVVAMSSACPAEWIQTTEVTAFSYLQQVISYSLHQLYFS